MSNPNKGRTLFEILTGRNKRDLRPLELQYHNPLEAKVGCSVSIDHDQQTLGINFFIEKISVYETKISEKKFYHTDYHLKGVTLEKERPIRMRLRLIPDDDASNKLGSKIQLLTLYDEMEWDEDLYSNVLTSDSGVMDVNYDDDGNQLDVGKRYWRVDDVLDPYQARVTILSDKNGDGKIEEEELERIDITYWDYHRDTEDINNIKFTESVFIEMNDKTRYFTFFRGREISAFQIQVV